MSKPTLAPAYLRTALAQWLLLSLGMTKLLLTHKQAMLAVELGCCIAMGTTEYVIGHAHPASCTELPVADLRTYPGPTGHVYVEALTEDGATFLSLVEA